MLTISLLPKEYNIQTGHFRAIMKEKIPVILATSILILFTFQGYPTLQNTQASLTYHKIELPPPPLPPIPDNDSLVVELPHVPVFDAPADFSNRYYSPKVEEPRPSKELQDIYKAIDKVLGEQHKGFEGLKK
jgi:hypothetical protein